MQGDPPVSFLSAVIEHSADFFARHATRRALCRSAVSLSLLLGACVPAVPVAPSAQPTAGGVSQWRVEPGDVIRLRVWLSPEQSGDLPVNERGLVLLPTVGRLAVVGLTPEDVEVQVTRALAARLDSSRVDVTFLRPVSVLGGVRTEGVQLADPSSSVLSLISRAGGPLRPGGDLKVYLLRIGDATREISTADRVSNLGIRSTDQIYVEDPPFIVRNQIALQSLFEALQLLTTVVTLFVLLRR
jgi:protein involved in polysaccharide export with SLBB domain